MSRSIHLTQGKIAQIDDEDLELVNQFKWRAQRITVKGTIYGYYAITGQANEATLMHRLIMGVSQRLPRELREEVDHIDGDGLNNRKANLRLATRSENRRNSGKTGGSSKFKGVYWNRITQRWRAQIASKETGVQYLGEYDNEREAAAMYNLAAIMLFGEFAKLNYIKED